MNPIFWGNRTFVDLRLKFLVETNILTFKQIFLTVDKTSDYFFTRKFMENLSPSKNDPNYLFEATKHIRVIIFILSKSWEKILSVHQTIKFRCSILKKIISKLFLVICDYLRFSKFSCQNIILCKNH